MTKMNKVVYNACYGGFTLSPAAIEWIKTHHGIDIEKSAIDDPNEESLHSQWRWGQLRHHPVLVAVVEALGEEANGSSSFLVVAEIEDDRYYIEEYDGAETVMTPSSIKWQTI